MLKGKTQLRKVTTTIAMAAATVIATASIATASASHPDITSPQTIKLQARGGSVTFVNIRHKKGFAEGDEFIGTQPAYLPAHPKQVAGHTYVIITLLSTSATRDQATLVLRHGQIDLSGIEASNPFTLAVTGGTGTFANARGQATIKTGTGKGNPATITIHLLP